MPNNIIDKIQLSGVTYDIGGGGGTVSSAITSGDTNAVAGGAVYDKFDEVEQVTAAALNTLNEALSGKQDTLSAGTNITIVDNVINAEGGGKAITGGRGISITTGETADTVSFNLPISAGTGMMSIIEGLGAEASGDISHAEGFGTLARGEISHAEGDHTIANNEAEHASGKYNVSTSASTTFGDSGNTLFSVGNGTADNARHNAFEIRQNGDIYFEYDGVDTKLQDRFDEVEQVTAQALNVLNGRLDEDEEVTAAAFVNLNEALSGKQDTLSAGENITISGNVISATGGGGISSAECQTMIDSSISGKTDTSAFTAYTAATNTALNNKLATSAVTSTITAGDTNPVQGGTLYNELRVSGQSSDVTVEFDSGWKSTNFPSNCTTVKVEVTGTNNSASINFLSGIYGTNVGMVGIYNYGSITVSNVSFADSSYEISGNTVIITYPSSKEINALSVYDSPYTIKATPGVSCTPLKDIVAENTTALGGLKLQKLTQQQYDALATKDNSTLYVIVG